MANTFAESEEQSTILRKPALLHPSRMGSPAQALPVISLITFISVLVFLLSQGDYRSYFHLLGINPQNSPIPSLPLLSGILIIIIISLIWRVKNRPDAGWFPRWWNIMLLIILIASVVMYFYPETGIKDIQALPAILILSGASATLVLIPRFFRISLDNKLLPLISLSTLIMIYPSVIGFAYYLGKASIKNQHVKSNYLLDKLESHLLTIEELNQFDWTRMGRNIQGARTRINAIDKDFFPSGAELNAWKAIFINSAYSARVEKQITEITYQLGNALSIEHIPKLSQINEPAISYRDRWVRNEHFPTQAKLVYDYLHQLGRAWINLTDFLDRMDAVEAKRLADRAQTKEKKIRQDYAAIRNSWADHWSLTALPNNLKDTSPDQLRSLEMLLETPLTPLHSKTELLPGDFDTLFSTSHAEIKALSEHLTSCQPREYTEKKNTYYRLDCYAYKAAHNDANPAQLHVEFRILYKLKGQKPATNYPHLIYLILPSKNRATIDQKKDLVMQQLYDVVTDYWSGSIQAFKRSGSATGGFALNKKGQSIEVRSFVKSYIEGYQSIEVNAEKVRASRK